MPQMAEAGSREEVKVLIVKAKFGVVTIACCGLWA